MAETLVELKGALLKNELEAEVVLADLGVRWRATLREGAPFSVTVSVFNEGVSDAPFVGHDEEGEWLGTWDWNWEGFLDAESAPARRLSNALKAELTRQLVAAVSPAISTLKTMLQDAHAAVLAEGVSDWNSPARRQRAKIEDATILFRKTYAVISGGGS